jgi:hypothetical protein
MGREGDHEWPIGLSAEGQAPAAAARAALHPAAGPGGRAGHEPHALPLQPRRLGAELGGGIDHQALGRRQTEGGLIGGAHGEMGVGPGRPQVPGGAGQLEQQVMEQRLDRLEQLVLLIAQQVGVPPEAITRLLPPAAPPT